MTEEDGKRDEIDLDPRDWIAVRAQAHSMLDDILDYVEAIRTRPVWQPIPSATREAFRERLPAAPQPLRQVHAEFMTRILPYATGNSHPRFMGWVHGGGNVFGMLGEMLAAGLNANLGGRDHIPIEVERQVIRWSAEFLGLPETAGGLLVTGTSIANFIGVLIAKVAVLGTGVRSGGVTGERLTAYSSVAAHGCIPRAMDMAGLGTDALRSIPVDEDHRIDVAALAQRIQEDRAAGHRPFLVVGTTGTVGVGAIDDLTALAALCKNEGLWFHVDGAFGALGMLAPSLKPLLAGIEAADSVAFDFHKWGQAPYDAGCIVVRDGAHQLRAFGAEAAYLRKETRGLAAGAPWPCDLGPDLSRGFRALKVWFTLKTLGATRIGASIEHTCALARRLAERIDSEPLLERLAPVALNIVCFRYRFASDADRQNAELAADLQEAGVVVLSTTKLGDKISLRAAIVNHRTRAEDIDATVDAVLEVGKKRSAALPSV
ncbi:MAG: pyridoxal phosphate-dependent decarboxylase family protein [Polyangiaceae bacterium]